MRTQPANRFPVAFGFARWHCPMAAAVSGGLVGLAFPEPGLRVLAWPALVPWLWSLRSAGPGSAALSGIVYAFAVSLVAGLWFPTAVVRYFDQSPAIGIALYAITIAGTGGLYYGAFAGIVSLCRRKRAVGPVAVVLLTATTFAACELVRVRGPLLLPDAIGNPWGVLGYTQAGWPLFLQITSATGVFGVSFVLVAFAAGIAETVGASDGRARIRAAIAGVAPTLLAAGWGAIVLSGTPPIGSSADSLRVAAIQGSLEISERWRLERRGENLDVYLRLTREAASRHDAGLVVWPELAMTFRFEEEPFYQRLVFGGLAHLGVDLLAGGARASGTERGRFTNSVFSLARDGAIRGRYDKRLLIPLAEYRPWWAPDLVRRDFGGLEAFMPGARQPPPETALGPAGVLICQEAMFGQLASDRVDEGARWLVNPANDSWVGDRSFALQQLDIAILRAVEQGRFLVRASTAGPSAIVDPWGRVLARSEPLAEAVVAAEVAPRSERTFYSRFGDAFGGLCGLVTLGWIAVSVRSRRSRVASS